MIFLVFLIELLKRRILQIISTLFIVPAGQDSCNLSAFHYVSLTATTVFCLF
ncbi:hypothetical protein HK097_003601, partial [Rhizophlyctis rosea]